MNPIILKLRTDELVMGTPVKETDRGIDLKDTLSLRYSYNNSGYPVLYFSKYSLFTRSFDVFFSMQDVMHVFRDPVKGIVEYYEQNVQKLHEIARDDIALTKEDLFDEDNDMDYLEALLAKGSGTLN